MPRCVSPSTELQVGHLDARRACDRGGPRADRAWCGLTGLKPTSGAIPRTGVVPLSWTAKTVGPLCRRAGRLTTTSTRQQAPIGLDHEADGASARAVRV
ncbi:amidase family protein [Pseudonocardia sp. N23]|uniref:amidase family protein n=1 Tax=Pseudonocardia sp. N23 TaxID=1987376 RepID=UPI000BFE0DA5|nr:amidase family protein [Pseudonocardia sp. N23]